MIQFAVAYVGTALAMLVLDIIWLTQMVNRLYQPRIGELLAEKPSMPPAVVFYLLYVAGIVILAVMPALREGGWKRLLVHAAVFGLVAYATYDLTNQATMKTWSTTITLVDMAWGTFITTVAASAGYAAARWFAIETGGATAHSDAAFEPGDAFLFGSERAGLPAAALAAIPSTRHLSLPMRAGNRSLNLSNAVAVVVYEAWRQCGYR